ncbi:MAG: DNA mismatch repair endonuclease MutL [Eubacterium sp.]
MKIKMLNNETINKIAAGEVIIRPVSVIKELVENAIDADSSRIHIIIEKGGKTSICVLDNGIGIAYNEVALAFKRHATSKLLTIEDLESVETLGFRGEALSSISAVSRVRVTTKTKDEEIGNQSYFEGGSMINQRVCTYDKGTEVLVSDLFYNTPARQKHLQKDKNEEKLIRDILEKLSMSHPEISFSYTSDGREVFKTPGTGVLKDVIESLYGRDFFKRLRPLNIENTPMRLKGYISDLTLTRSTREEQIFFINNRYIRNKNLSRAFEEAYEGYMMVHKHPVGLIFMELPGKMLDINIHPAKTEIQILNESLVNILFKQGIRESLKSQNLVVDAKMVIKEDKKIEPSKNIEEPVTFFEKEKLDFESAVIPVQINGKNKLEDKKVEDVFDVTIERSKDRRVTEEKSEHKNTEPLVTSRVEESVSPYFKRVAPDFEHAKIIGQLFSTYILLEKDDEIMMLDQHAAHEAFLYQELSELFRTDASFPAQTLLVPQTIDISLRESESFDELQPKLMKYGFECDLFGKNALVVRSVPIILGEPQDIELIRIFIESQVYEDTQNPRNQIERIITMSCKKAVKGHQNLTIPEIKELLDGLRQLDNPYTCPHGRPIILKLKEYELKKLFKRVV